MIEVESNTGRRIVRVLYITARATDDYDYIQSDVTLNDAETLPDIPINPAGRPFTPNEVSGPDWQLTNSGVDQQPADDETYQTVRLIGYLILFRHLLAVGLCLRLLVANLGLTPHWV